MARALIPKQYQTIVIVAVVVIAAILILQKREEQKRCEGVKDCLSYWLNPFDTRAYKDAFEAGQNAVQNIVGGIIRPFIIPAVILVATYVYVKKNA